MSPAYQLHYTWVHTSGRFRCERVPCDMNLGDGYTEDLPPREGYNASVVQMDSTHSVAVSARMYLDYSHA